MAGMNGFHEEPAAPASPDSLDLCSEGGRLMLSGERFHLKGITWFGFESSKYVVDGLDKRRLTSILDLIAANGFNALRLPLSVGLALALDGQQPDISREHNPDLQGLTAGGVLDKLVAAAGERGILIVLSIHCLAPGTAPGELWYSNIYTEGHVSEVLQRLARRYKDTWNFIGIDLADELHGQASWGTGLSVSDWRLAAQRLGNAVLLECPRLLIFVQGVERNCSPVQTPEYCFWGGALCSAVEKPVKLCIPGRLVYAAHTMGPSAELQSHFNDTSFPANLPGIWDRQWGHATKTGSAVVLGAWAGTMDSLTKDREWGEALVEYLRARGLTDSFFLGLNPTVSCVEGLLKPDWTTANPFKLDLLHRLCPHPSKVQKGGWAKAGAAKPGKGKAEK